MVNSVSPPAMPKKKPRNPDHIRRRNTPLANNEAINQHLKDLLSLTIYAQSVRTAHPTS